MATYYGSNVGKKFFGKMLSLHFKIDFPVSIKYAETLKYNFSGTLWKETRNEHKLSWTACIPEHPAG